jgi:outer membrane receptor protein involved in Fe transport
LKKLLLTLTVLLFLTAATYAQKSLNSIVGFECQNRPLTEFLNKAEAQTGLRFFYKDNWVNSITIPTATKGKEYKWVIDKAISAYGLTYIIFQSNNIIFIPQGFTVDNDKLIEGMVGYVKVIGNLMEKGRYKENKVEGIVREGKTETPIAGAVIQDKKHRLATTSDANGHYELMLPAGQTELEISFIGLETEVIKIDVLSPGKLDVDLMEASIALEGVTVTAAGGKSQVNRTQMGVEAMDMQTIKKLPVLMGEADIVRSMTLMPGVQTAGEMSTGFNVRGGNVDQNLVLLNEAPIYNTSHMFGMFSTFLPNSISGVELYKSSQPAGYGNRISSVMDISLKKADTTKFHGNAGIGILNSNVFIEAPIKDFCSFYVGGRATYSNWILQKSHNVNIKNSSTDFHDLIAKFDFKLGRNHRLDIFGYESADFFNYNNINKFDYSSLIGGMNYRWLVTQALQFKLSAAYSDYKSTLSDLSQESLSRNVTTGINHIRGKAECLLDLLNHNLNFGIETNRLDINPGKQTAYNEKSSVEPQELDHENGIELAGFISDNYTVSENLSLIVGLRYSWFSKIGSCTERTYSDTLPRNNQSIIESTDYANGKLVHPYHGLEPRIGLRYKLSPISSIKASYSYTRQYQQLISSNTSAMPSDYWKMSDSNIKPMNCKQVSAGYFATVVDEMFDLSAEIYYKTIENQLDYKNGAVLTMNKTVEQDVLPGEVRSYGLELMVKKNFGNLTGWISYTLSNTEMKVDGQFDEEKINGGRYYKATTHHLHDLSITGSYQITRRWTASANFVFTSGRPVTYPEYKYSISGMEVVNYSDRNKYQLPAYHRLDLSATYDGFLNKKRKIHPSLTFALYNAYGHKNIYSVYYKKATPSAENDYNAYGLYKLSIIGVPIPSVTLNLKF